MNAFLPFLGDTLSGRSALCGWWALQRTRKDPMNALKPKLMSQRFQLDLAFVDCGVPINAQAGPAALRSSLEKSSKDHLWPSLHISDPFEMIGFGSKIISTSNSWNKTKHKNKIRSPNASPYFDQKDKSHLVYIADSFTWMQHITKTSLMWRWV